METFGNHMQQFVLEDAIKNLQEAELSKKELQTDIDQAPEAAR